MHYTKTAKIKLVLGIEVLQKYGREGATICDQMLKEKPITPEFDKEGFLRELEKRIKGEGYVNRTKC